MQWVIEFAEHLYWFAMRIYKDNTGEEHDSILLHIALNIARHNKEVIKKLIYFYRHEEKTEQIEMWEKMLELAHDLPDDG